MKWAKADGEKVAALRGQKGWTQEALADQTRLSRGAIQRVERGVNVLLDTLHRVAAALDVKVLELLSADARHCAEDRSMASPDNAPSSGAATFTRTELLNIEVELAGKLPWDPEKRAKFLEALGVVIDNADSVRITRVSEGSVIVTLQMTPEQAEQLIRAWDDGRLEHLDILEIREERPQVMTGIPTPEKRSWDAFFHEYVAQVQENLKNAPWKTREEYEAFREFFDDIKKTQSTPHDDEENLREILFRLVTKKAIELARVEEGEKSGGTKGQASTVGDESIIGRLVTARPPEPSLEIATTMIDTIDYYLAGLGDDDLRRISIFKMRGLTNTVIAMLLGTSESDIERQSTRIRTIWRNLSTV